MNFCSHCAHPVEIQVPAGDNRPRYVCPSCGTIHYQNPKVVAGTVPTYKGKVLLCKRAIEPRLGYWTLPAGFMENEETLEQAAARETWEEAHARVDDLHLYALYSIPHISQIYMLYLSEMEKPEYASGPESLEVELFAPDEIPWDQLSFKIVDVTLKHWVRDLEQGEYPLHRGEIDAHRKVKQA